MYKAILYVPGICCVESFQVIEELLKSLTGINSVRGTLPKGKIVVEFQPSNVSTMDLVKIIEKQGYPVVKNTQKEMNFDIYN
ncbi:heavy-metal-associated domain-containing protein [Bacillus dakarensis]|uniref:heavy-metal-associated domain-containing protein n=1 Tax=Robertmurraya dakarensis TaxID=1926278 RepID=UPI000981C296|nr:heavy-metal-associated domain-containing protein [Bacillus dakarensis]